MTHSIPEEEQEEEGIMGEAVRRLAVRVDTSSELCIALKADSSIPPHLSTSKAKRVIKHYDHILSSCLPRSRLLTRTAIIS